MTKIVLIALAAIVALALLWLATFTGGFVAYCIFGANDAAVAVGAIGGGVYGCSKINSIFFAH